MPPAPPRALLVALLEVACRSGGIAGTGAPCSVDDDCRAAYRCDQPLSVCVPRADSPPLDASPDAHGSDLGAEASWTPRALPGMVLWLDAGAGVVRDDDQKVARWSDLSGRGNDARQDLAAMRPTVGDDGAGHPVLAFHAGGVLLRVSDNESLRWGTDDFSVYVVGSMTNTVWNPAPFIRKESSSEPYVGWILDSNYSDEGAAGRLCGQLRFADVRVCSAESGHNDGALVMFGVQRTAGTRLAVRVNGRPSGETSVLVLDVSAPGQDLFIGGHGFQPSFQLEGTIAEIVAARGPLSEADREALERYLLEKHRLH